MCCLSAVRRWWHRRGFGVQSPWAYEFVTDALFDRHRYYAFDTLNGTPGDEQLFRIMNWLRPRRYIAASETNSAVRHMNAAFKALRDENKTDCELYYFAADRTWEVAKALKGGWVGEHTCMIIEGIDRRETQPLWQQLVASPLTTSTFDLGTRGIVFFDPARQKQNYQL